MATVVEQIEEDYLPRIPEIPEDSRYWFFRTETGSLFEPFITSNSIAIGYPSIGMDVLKRLSLGADDRKALTQQIALSHTGQNRPGLVASQLLKFVHELRGGDFVIIPSFNSTELAIGVILDEAPFETELTYQGQEIRGYSKRRAVRWLKRVHRDKANPNLYKVFYAQQTITEITAYAQWVDILLFDFFRKGDAFHLVLQINKPDGINARDLFESGLDLFELADAFSREMGLGGDSRTIETRLNLNSPGAWELITPVIQTIFVVGAAVLFLNGGGLKLSVKEWGMNVNLSTDGLVRAISRFLQDRKQDKLTAALTDKLHALQVSDPKDLERLIETVLKDKR